MNMLSVDTQSGCELPTSRDEIMEYVLCGELVDLRYWLLEYWGSLFTPLKLHLLGF